MNGMQLSIRVIEWHYTRGILDFFHIWKNFFSFIYRIFSLPDLFRTLFSPWRRLTEPYKRGPGLDLEQFFGALVANIMMRLLGFFTRAIFIAFGLALLFLILFFGTVFLIVWVLIPLAIIGAFGLGTALLFF